MKNLNFFEIIFTICIFILPVILIDIESEFLLKQFAMALLINLFSCIIILMFFYSLNISKNLTNLFTFLLTLWICILPIIFYKIYLKNPVSFAYNKEYLKFQKQLNSDDFDINENKFITLKSKIINDINKSIFKKKLPKDCDTLILLENFIILSPQTIRGNAGLAAPRTYIKLYDKFTGKFILQFEKKSDLLESYNYNNHNINFKINKVKRPKIGISFFDFWCSSTIGFKDNLINPLRNWVTLLNIIFITIILTPIFNYAKSKLLNTKNNNEN
jgi:hypothetical protein